MEYFVFVLAMAAFVAVIFIMEAARARKEEKRFMLSLYQDYGRTVEKEYALERFVRMDSYFSRHRREGQLDDITWNDLGMDDLFRRMNDTLSASGEEYLYYTLRTLKQSDEELRHLEEVTGFFSGHPDERVKAQLAARRLGYTGKYSLYDYIDNLDILGERSNGKNILMDLLFLPLIGVMAVHFSLGLIGIVVLIICNIISYFKEKDEIDPYITSFSYIMRLMQACGELEKIPVPVCGGEWAEIRKARKNLQEMKRNSYWVMSPYRGNASGDVLAVLMDYIRMVFHVDLIKFNGMLKVLRGHIEDVDALIGVMGYVETAIAIGAFRLSLEARASAAFRADEKKDVSGDAAEVNQAIEADRAEERQKTNAAAVDGESSVDIRREPGSGYDAKNSKGWCVPEFIGEELIEIAEGYHPLLERPVKNGITARRGVLLTGSNASGKSTFLKTVAVNAILAQTIHTCAADAYRAPFFQVYSSMALKDDIASGESYYIVEIKALKRILDAAAQRSGMILCFVDEVLRGTNTVERIAASTQILKSLGHSGILCFAATHDIELTELLQNDFDNYHFEEDVRDGDIFFNYRLKSGKATTRNAIRLLELMGYDQAVIERASAQAEQFVASGVWKRI